MLYLKRIGFVLLICLVLWAPAASARLTFVDEDAGTNDNNFYLDKDDSAVGGETLDLQFGISRDARLRFDITTDTFFLNRNLNLEDLELESLRLENLASAPTCDGTTIGKVYYNTSTSTAQICNGSTWEDIGSGGGGGGGLSALSAVQVRRDTNLTIPALNTFTDVPFNLTDVENNTAVLEHNNTNTDNVEIKETGLYRITYQVNANDAAVTHVLNSRVRVNDTTVLNGSMITGSNYQNEYSPHSAIFLAQLTAGDFLTLQVERTTANELIGETLMTVVKFEALQGATGPAGPAGAPGTVGGGTDSETFVLDQDDTGGDIVLQFGTTLDERFTWDNANGRFSLSDDLRIEGNQAVVGQTFIADDHSAANSNGTLNLGRNGNAWESLVWDDTDGRFVFSGDVQAGGSLGAAGTFLILDTDNVGIGSDINIVAIQGIDANGTLRYSASANQWQISNDGGGFNAISTFVPAIAQVYQLGTTAFDAVTPITWNGVSPLTRIVDTSAYTHSTVTNPSRVTVLSAGLYRVAYNVNWDTDNNNRRTAKCQMRVNGSIPAVPVGVSYDYSRNSTDNEGSNSASFLYTFSANDYYEIVCESVGSNGNMLTFGNESWTTIEKIR